MKKQLRNNTVKTRRRHASAVDLRQALNRAKKLVATSPNSLASPACKTLPQPCSMFLGDIPELGVIYEPQHAISKQLKNIIETAYYTGNFEEAITHVAAQNIPELDQIQSLYQFYYYVDALVTWIPEIRVWDWNGDILHERTPYLRICQFYYYFNQESLVSLQSPIDPVEGKELSPISLWLRDFAVAWGEFLDTPASGQCLESFQYAPEYDWQEFEKKPQDYETFNAFFARTFKDIATQRPVAQQDNDHIVVFPAESTFVGHWPVSTPVGDPLPAPASVVIKHIEWSIHELLQDSQYADCFAGGTFCHSFLNTYDYHRQHTPVSGTVLEAKFIPGQVYLEVNVQDQAETGLEHGDLARAVIPQRYLNAEDPTGYQFVQCRGLLVLDSPIGKVAILPMGMAQVSSVVFVRPESEGSRPIVLSKSQQEKHSYDQQVKLLNEKINRKLVGKDLKKGEMFSYFQFGGSDCVMVFERKANIDYTATVGTHYQLRSQYAVANLNA